MIFHNNLHTQTVYISFQENVLLKKSYYDFYEKNLNFFINMKKLYPLTFKKKLYPMTSCDFFFFYEKIIILY